MWTVALPATRGLIQDFSKRGVWHSDLWWNSLDLGNWYCIFVVREGATTTRTLFGSAPGSGITKGRFKGGQSPISDPILILDQILVLVIYQWIHIGIEQRPCDLIRKGVCIDLKGNMYFLLFFIAPDINIQLFFYEEQWMIIFFILFFTVTTIPGTTMPHNWSMPSEY